MKVAIILCAILGATLAQEALEYNWELLAQNMTYGGISADDVTYYYYSRKSPGGTKITHSTVSALKGAGFTGSKETLFLIHGYYSGYDSRPFPQQTQKDLLALSDYDIICLDWRPIWKNNGAGAVFSSLGNIGGYIGDVVSQMQKEFGLKLNNVQIIGHSVGGHLTGTAGNALHGEVKNIIGLDPANVVGAGDHRNRISTSSGKFVEIIHSCAGATGVGYSCGHADYWPNGGAHQAGCDSSGCNHGRAIDYWAESFKTKKFIAHKCDSYASFTAGKCNSNPTGIMGTLEPDSAASGNYYLATNAHPPFAKG